MAGMRVRRVGAALVVLGAALVVVSSTAAATKSRPVVGQFFVSCSLGVRNHDDPVVKPGQPGASHEHDFYGSRAATANATVAAMRHAKTTCGEPGDTAGYWHPTLLVAGVAVRGRSNAYYDRGGLPTVASFPRGLKMVSGDPMAMLVRPASQVGFECVRPGAGGDLVPTTKPRAAFVRCRKPAQLAGRVVFPNCWNGQSIDSDDHRSHLAYPRRGRCPAGYPVAVPRLIVVVTWPVSGADPRTIGLSSGVATTWHADFWNTWNPVRLRRLVHNCVDENRNCGRVGTLPR